MFNRRQFIKTTSAIAAGAVLPCIKALAQVSEPVNIAQAVAAQKKRCVESQARIFEEQCWGTNLPIYYDWQKTFKMMTQVVRDTVDIQYKC